MGKPQVQHPWFSKSGPGAARAPTHDQPYQQRWEHCRHHEESPSHWLREEENFTDIQLNSWTEIDKETKNTGHIQETWLKRKDQRQILRTREIIQRLKTSVRMIWQNTVESYKNNLLRSISSRCLRRGCTYVALKESVISKEGRLMLSNVQPFRWLKKDDDCQRWRLHQSKAIIAERLQNVLAHISLLWLKSTAYTTSSSPSFTIFQMVPPIMWPAGSGVMERPCPFPVAEKAIPYLGMVPPRS